MSAASSVLSEDQFLCSICLDVFIDPVSTPCGHNFCKKCITAHWNNNASCECPICKKLFHTRPELQVNNFISEMVAHFRQLAKQKVSSSSSEQQAAKQAEVPCDVCTGTKLKALKSCLVCLVSYCETHLEPHLVAPGLKKHELIDPVKNLEGRMCMKHNKLLELFSKDDHVCMLCTILDHKAHDVVPLEEEYEGKKSEFGKIEAYLQQMIQERQLKIQEMKCSVKVSRENADREIENSVQLFTKLTDTIENNQTKVTEMIEEKHKTTKKQADGFIKELEQEISELKKRSAELEQLSRSQDHLNVFQTFLSLIAAAPTTRDWTEVRVFPPSYVGNVRKAVARLLEILINEMKLVTKAEFKTVQQYAADVTLDPDTAQNKLVLSEDGKQVHHGDAERNLPDNPERFSTRLCVLGKPFVSSGLSYFEVQVKGKTNWIVGVAREIINRKELTNISPENGYWTVRLRNGNEFYALDEPPVRLSLKLKPGKVGVFVDYEQGLVSFYSVDTASLLCSFTDCSFTGKLLPFFSPCHNEIGKNSFPLIICPVEHAE